MAAKSLTIACFIMFFGVFGISWQFQAMEKMCKILLKTGPNTYKEVVRSAKTVKNMQLHYQLNSNGEITQKEGPPPIRPITPEKTLLKKQVPQKKSKRSRYRNTW